MIKQQTALFINLNNNNLKKENREGANMKAILTMKEILKSKGYSDKQINQFYRKRDRLAKSNVRYTIEQWERDNRA